jgi:CBS domain-containing protein
MSPVAPEISKMKLPICSSKDGVLEAMRLMAERRVRKVLVVDDTKSIVGSFRLEDNRLRYVSAGSPC